MEFLSVNVFSVRACSPERENGSKVALIALAKILEENGYLFIDCQFHTEHLRAWAEGTSRGKNIIKCWKKEQTEVSGKKKIQMRKPDYFERFQCSASDCTDNCCIGWEIDIDERTAERYKKVQGELGQKA